MSAYRYYRWTITAVRGGGATVAQAQEFYLRNNGSEIAWPGSSVATNPGGSNPGGQEAPKLIDGSTSSKWLDLNGATTVVKFDCQTATEVKGYDWMTGDDANDRDPITWTFAGSNDDSSYTTLDTRNPGDPGVTTSRTTKVGPWDYEAPSGGSSIAAISSGFHVRNINR